MFLLAILIKVYEWEVSAVEEGADCRPYLLLRFKVRVAHRPTKHFSTPGTIN